MGGSCSTGPPRRIPIAMAEDVAAVPSAVGSATRSARFPFDGLQGDARTHALPRRRAHATSFRALRSGVSHSPTRANDGDDILQRLDHGSGSTRPPARRGCGDSHKPFTEVASHTFSCSVPGTPDAGGRAAMPRAVRGLSVHDHPHHAELLPHPRTSTFQARGLTGNARWTCEGLKTSAFPLDQACSCLTPLVGRDIVSST
jgi:hypothetical protein